MQALCTPNFMVWAHTLWLGTTTNFNSGAHDYTWHCPHTSPCLEEDTFNGNEAYPNLLGPVAMTQTTTRFLQKCIHPFHRLDKLELFWCLALLYPLYPRQSCHDAWCVMNNNFDKWNACEGKISKWYWVESPLWYYQPLPSHPSFFFFTFTLRAVLYMWPRSLRKNGLGFLVVMVSIHHSQMPWSWNTM